MKTKQIPLKIEEELKDQFDKIIKEKNINKSALLRSWIKYYVKHDGNSDFRESYEQGFQDGTITTAQSLLERLQLLEKELLSLGIEIDRCQLGRIIEDLKVVLNKGE